MSKVVEISLEDFIKIEEKIKKLEAQIKILLKANKRYEEQAKLVSKNKKEMESK